MAGAEYNDSFCERYRVLFIATGQDEANVVESHAGIMSYEFLVNSELYLAVTLPSLICATYGGGTGLLPKECLNLLKIRQRQS